MKISRRKPKKKPSVILKQKYFAFSQFRYLCYSKNQQTAHFLKHSSPQKSPNTVTTARWPKMIDYSVVSTTEVRTTAMLVLLKIWCFWGSLQYKNSRTVTTEYED
jgi:hypothetical protein